ncbi:MAG: hypothetical protein JNK85_05020 [Verrucomicrobiales bacterium]|nr:hypothetical protein [Verrucomicrobiales bacterium]
MAPQLAKSLVPLALIYAAHSDAAFRNGIQAKAVAESACELSEWKLVPALDALAAACAELQDFPNAVRWQERAIALAPANQTAELRSRLQRYLARQPYRMAPPAPTAP